MAHARRRNLDQCAGAGRSIFRGGFDETDYPQRRRAKVSISGLRCDKCFQTRSSIRTQKIYISCEIYLPCKFRRARVGGDVGIALTVPSVQADGPALRFAERLADFETPWGSLGERARNDFTEGARRAISPVAGASSGGTHHCPPSRARRPDLPASERGSPRPPCSAPTAPISDDRPERGDGGRATRRGPGRVIRNCVRAMFSARGCRAPNMPRSRRMGIRRERILPSPAVFGFLAVRW